MSFEVSRRRFGQILGASVAAAVAPIAAQAEPSCWRSLNFLDQDGQTFKVDDLRAPLTLIKLWVYSCPICVAEMGSLAAMAAAIGSRTIDVILLSHPEWWARDKEFARIRHLPFRLATLTSANGPGMVRAALTEEGVYAVPRTMVVKGSTGTMTWSRRGGRDWTSAATLNELRASMG